MKIVVKHVDNLNSSLIKTREEVPQYLVYLMTDDNISISCDITNGNIDKLKLINNLQSGYSEQLLIEEITLDVFKNNVLLNEDNNVGN